MTVCNDTTEMWRLYEGFELNTLILDLQLMLCSDILSVADSQLIFVALDALMVLLQRFQHLLLLPMFSLWNKKMGKI